MVGAGPFGSSASSHELQIPHDWKLYQTLLTLDGAWRKTTFATELCRPTVAVIPDALRRRTRSNFTLQLRGTQIAQNVFFNWLGTIANMAVGFFLAPFILHRLGDLAYGVWVLSVSIVGYLALLDFGIHGAIIRYVSQGYTQSDHESASEAASAAFWVRLQISLIVIILSAGIAALFPKLFKIPSAIAGEAQTAVVLIGLTTAITLSLGVAGGVVTALNRFDIQTSVGLLQTFIRVVGIVYVLRTGHGIVAIAVCELVSTTVGRSTQVWMAKRLYPELRIRLKIPSRETFGKIWSYSFYAFLVTIGTQLIYQSDNLVVGTFVSAVAVTFYAIASSLCRYAGQVISSMTSAFTPAASTFEAAGDSTALVNLYKNGTRAMIVVALPIMLTLVFRGSTFIGLWMGQKYAHTSGLILLILAVPLFFSFINQTGGAIAMGIGKHRIFAKWVIGEGVANLALSVILVHFYGIYGVAIGTLIPSLISQLGFWPVYASRMIGLPPWHILLKIWTPVILSGIPFAVTSYFLDRLLPPHNLPEFFFQVFLALPVSFLTSALVFREFVRERVIPKLRSELSAVQRKRHSLQEIR